MKIKEIKDLIDFLSASGLEEVNIETEELKIAIKRSNETQVVERAVSAAPAAQPAPAPVAVPTPAPQAASTPSEPAADSGNLLEIKSPMIGTFYASANPESDAFVEVGTEVSIGQTVCIVEAMKLFNEIESEVSGKIVKILAKDSEPVEFDQPLFLVDPS